VDSIEIWVDGVRYDTIITGSSGVLETEYNFQDTLHTIKIVSMSGTIRLLDYIIERGGNTSVWNINVSGINTKDFLSLIDSDWDKLKSYKPSLFTVRLGANDKHAYSADSFKVYLTRLVDTLRGLYPNVSLQLCTIERGGEPYALVSPLTEYNQAVYDVAKIYSLQVVDVYNLWYDWDRVVALGCAADGIHENIKGGEVIAALYYKTLKYGASPNINWGDLDAKQDTVSNMVTGTGTANYVTKFTGVSTIGNSIIRDDGSTTGIGIAPSSTYKLNVNGRLLSDKFQYTRAIDISSTDLNNLTIAGFYNGYSLTNSPTAGWYFIMVERYTDDSDYVKQTATSFGVSNTINRTYTRVKLAGNWGSWNELLGSNNISGVANYGAFWSGTNSLTSPTGNNLFWNSTYVSPGITGSSKTLLALGYGANGTNSWFNFSDESGYVNLAWWCRYNGTNWIKTYDNTIPGFRIYSAYDGLHYDISGIGGIGDIVTFSTIMNLNSNGNVGIGTSSPAKPLHVTGGARITDLDTDATAPTTSGTTKMVISDANGDLSFAAIPTDTDTDTQDLSIDSLNRVFTISLTDGGSVKFKDIDTNSGGTVTSVSGTVPILVATGTTTPVISISSDTLTSWRDKQNKGVVGYNDKINSLAFSGTTTKTLTLTQQDGGTVSNTFTDLGITAEVDGSITNEGYIGLKDTLTNATKIFNSNSSGTRTGKGLTLQGATGINVVETLASPNSWNGGTIALTVEDNSKTNEGILYLNDNNYTDDETIIYSNSGLNNGVPAGYGISLGVGNGLTLTHANPSNQYNGGTIVIGLASSSEDTPVIGKGIKGLTAQSISNASLTVVDIISAPIEEGIEVNTTNNNFTINSGNAGFFEISYSFAYRQTSAAQDMTSIIYVNGQPESDELLLTTVGNAVYVPVSKSTILELFDGDIIDVRSSAVNGNSYTINNATITIKKIR
jgi:hypothetical protein